LEYFRLVCFGVFHSHGGTGLGSAHKPLPAALASCSTSSRLASPEAARCHQANPSLSSSCPTLRPSCSNNLGRHPTLLISREPSYDNIAVADIGSDRLLRLFAIRLLEFRAIDVFKMDHFVVAVVTNGQLIALVDGDDSRDKVRP
jgi:hypothetical protein